MNPPQFRRLKTTSLLVVFFPLAAAVFLRPAPARAVLFSVDPASPSIAGPITPDDVLKSGPAVVINGNPNLGLQDNFFGGVFDNLNAVSSGTNVIPTPGMAMNSTVFFSVDRVAVGAPGSAVNTEAAPGSEEAHGDVFTSIPGSSTNTQHLDEQALGLIPGFFGDDLDALEFDSGLATANSYFSIDSLSASNAFGAGTAANDVFLGAFNTLFASGEADIGLMGGDDIDALTLQDADTVGTLDAGVDRALFSLSAFSPSIGTLLGGHAVGSGDIFFTDFNGSYSLWATAAQIGLRADDELNALHVPEPARAVLLILGLIAGSVSRRR